MSTSSAAHHSSEKLPVVLHMSYIDLQFLPRVIGMRVQVYSRFHIRSLGYVTCMLCWCFSRTSISYNIVRETPPLSNARTAELLLHANVRFVLQCDVQGPQPSKWGLEPPSNMSWVYQHKAYACWDAPWGWSMKEAPWLVAMPKCGPGKDSPE